MTKQIEQFRQQKDDFFKKHPQSPLPPETRASFTGLVYYAVDPNLAFTLTAEELDPKEEIQMQTSTGDLRRYQRWGQVHFVVDAQEAALTLYYSPELGHFFLPFMDATSGSETYGAGRYLDPQQLEDGVFVIDFNLAYAPFCAYNPNYSCPIPPSENRLKVPIRAGEKLGVL